MKSDETPLQKLARELQQRLGTIPDSSQALHAREHFSAYLIRRIYALKIKMYQESGHALPHIHIDHGHGDNHSASYSIDPPGRLEGHLDARSELIVLDWLASNKEGSLQAWQSLQDGSPNYTLLAELKAGA